MGHQVTRRALAAVEQRMISEGILIENKSLSRKDVIIAVAYGHAAKQMRQMFSSANWTVDVVVESQKLITSDTAIMGGTSSVPSDREDAVLPEEVSFIIPMSPSSLLRVSGDHSVKSSILTDDEIMMINLGTLYMAKNAILACNEESLLQYLAAAPKVREQRPLWWDESQS